MAENLAPCHTQDDLGEEKMAMDYQRFYKVLFEPLERALGPIDENTIFAIIGFDAGGPLNFCTIGASESKSLITYISCELAVRHNQIPTRNGAYRYEFLTSCDDEKWVRKVVTSLGRMSMNFAFDHGHTVDVGLGANEDALKNGSEQLPQIQGVLLQSECTVDYQGGNYGILRCVGITRPEMEYCRAEGSQVLIEKLKSARVWPNTFVQRKSVI
jgi:hypothetical protein